jgi:hypothetical protein
LFFHYFKKAADLGHKDVIFKYDTLLEKVDTSSTNSLEVLSWMKKAADFGHKNVMLNYS